MRPSKWLVFIRPFLAGFDRPLTMLEDICLASVSDKPGYPCLEAYFKCLTERTGRQDYHSKAKFRAWMASQSDYELYVGKAAVEGYLPFAHAAFDPLAQFLAAM